MLGFGNASVQAAALGPFGWIAWIGAGLAALTTTISTVKGFNDGGIVNGSTTTGDNTLVRVIKLFIYLFHYITNFIIFFLV